MQIEAQLEKMRVDWNARALENARHYVATGQEQWSDEAFLESGCETVRNYILTDMENICRGANPKHMRVLEIGCGAGRVTSALAEIFGEVYAVDVSEEMIRHASEATASRNNVQLFKSNGKDLDVLPAVEFDFAFSCLVFQHIPSREVIQSYVRSVAKVLRSGCLFKFQLQGASVESSPDDTWVGVSFSSAEAHDLARTNHFQLLFEVGAETQDYWLWFVRDDRSLDSSVPNLLQTAKEGLTTDS